MSQVSGQCPSRCDAPHGVPSAALDPGTCPTHCRPPLFPPSPSSFTGSCPGLTHMVTKRTGVWDGCGWVGTIWKRLEGGRGRVCSFHCCK
ncbi:similar to inhibitor of MyoD family-a (predicted), isoform CRA_b [Rattus norvegicus]|uniref:Similar to inhibitor of MyoD family-a (Predicted), isoform CRA_b n=1 Tax=Rattus norvegicus TaxID=10116 RepID=A6JIH5_RAT|nr:similar to inhibitor of MyoD family-a (predicted), isoform CRA_b [Rattus norvegicus]